MEWTALEREYEDRRAEMRYEILGAAGEHEMVKVIADDPAAFAPRAKMG